MAEKVICPVCGRLFTAWTSKQKYCCWECSDTVNRKKTAERHRAKTKAKAEAKAKEVSTAPSPAPKPKAVPAPSVVLEAKPKPKIGRPRLETGPASPVVHGVCHDCGIPTHNYRCSKCLATWRAKHGVPTDIGGIGDNTTYTRYD
ncbi:MAG: hypothetical protein R3Y11_08515 [Pseudomonadota bacterium]